MVTGEEVESMDRINQRKMIVIINQKMDFIEDLMRKDLNNAKTVQELPEIESKYVSTDGILTRLFVEILKVNDIEKHNVLRERYLFLKDKFYRLLKREKEMINSGFKNPTEFMKVYYGLNVEREEDNKFYYRMYGRKTSTDDLENLPEFGAAFDSLKSLYNFYNNKMFNKYDYEMIYIIEYDCVRNQDSLYHTMWPKEENAQQEKVKLQRELRRKSQQEI